MILYFIAFSIIFENKGVSSIVNYLKNGCVEEIYQHLQCCVMHIDKQANVNKQNKQTYKQKQKDFFSPVTNRVAANAAMRAIALCALFALCAAALAADDTVQTGV